MKKNINVNINGIIFHIDEDAFEKLDNYLKSIKIHFKDNKNADEIVSDIENRISEMLKEKLSDTKAVITIADVSDIIERMGQPFEISDENDVSENELKLNRRKRLYRDTENKLLGGVCSGIAYYFGIDTIWIRLAFFLAFFIWGFGPVIYLVLWFVTPPAKSTIEKLEMKGEPINIASIEKNITDEFNSVKENLNNLKNNRRNYSKSHVSSKLSLVFEKFFSFILILLQYIAKTISVIIGVMFIMLGVFLITGFISTFFIYDDSTFVSSGGIAGFSFPFILNSIFESSIQHTLALIGLSLFIGVPLIMLIYNGIKMVFRFKYKTKVVGLSAFSLWLAGLVICAVVALQVLDDFSQKATSSEKISFKAPKSKNIHFAVMHDSEIDSLFNPNNKMLLSKWNLISKNKKALFFGVPAFEFQQSENDSIKVIMFTSARGNSKNDANFRTHKIIYNVSNNDTAILFSPYYRIKENEKWRCHELKILVKIPSNKNITFDKSMERILWASSNFDNYWNLDLQSNKWSVTSQGLIPEKKIDSLSNKINL